MPNKSSETFSNAGRSAFKSADEELKNLEIAKEILSQCVAEYDINFLKYIPLQLIKTLDNGLKKEIATECINFINENFIGSVSFKSDEDVNYRFNFLANNFATFLFNELSIDAYKKIPLELIKELLTNLPIEESQKISYQIKNDLINYLTTLSDQKYNQNPKFNFYFQSSNKEDLQLNSKDLLVANYDFLKNLLKFIEVTSSKKISSDKKLIYDILKLYEKESKQQKYNPEKLIFNILTQAASFVEDTALKRNILKIFDEHIQKLECLKAKKTNNPSSKIFPGHSQRLFKENFAQK